KQHERDDDREERVEGARGLAPETSPDEGRILHAVASSLILRCFAPPKGCSWTSAGNEVVIALQMRRPKVATPIWDPRFPHRVHKESAHVTGRPPQVPQVRH